MLGARPIDTTMDPNLKLLANQGEILHNAGQYCWSSEKPDISFIVSMVN